jgi:hypothetical protein
LLNFKAVTWRRWRAFLPPFGRGLNSRLNFKFTSRENGFSYFGFSAHAPHPQVHVCALRTWVSWQGNGRFVTTRFRNGDGQ